MLWRFCKLVERWPEGKRHLHRVVALDRQEIEAYALLLRQCEDLASGRKIHSQLVAKGCTDVFLCNLAIQMYGKWGSLDDARLVFEALECKNVYSWTILITAFARAGQNTAALLLYKQMLQHGIKPSQVTLVAIFDACSNLSDRPAALRQGKLIHESVEGEIRFNAIIENTLLSMYGKCGCLFRASSIFERMPRRDVVSWTAIIAANAQNGQCKEALQLYRNMISNNVSPTAVTYATVLVACCTSEDLETGRWIHSQVLASNLQDSFSIGHALVIMYTKCGSLVDARKTFENLQQKSVVSWNALTAAYSQTGQDSEALKLFRRMNFEGVHPNEITFSTVLSACSNLGALRDGEQIHALIVGTILELDEVLGNTLISFYGNCGSLERASDAFNSMRNKSTVSWNAMVAACVQHGSFEQVLLHFRKLDLEGLEANEFTFVAALDACSRAEKLELGRTIHARVVATGLNDHPIVGTSVVTLYAKSGKLAEAKQAFDKIRSRDVVTWNTLVAAYSKQGHGRGCLTSLQHMNCEGLLPSETVFTNILSACSHAGMVHEAWDCFHSMAADYEMQPLQNHCGCMVDLLSRSGRVQEMNFLINSWSTVLADWNEQMLEALQVDLDKQ